MEKILQYKKKSRIFGNDEHNKQTQQENISNISIKKITEPSHLVKQGNCQFTKKSKSKELLVITTCFVKKSNAS